MNTKSYKDVANVGDKIKCLDFAGVRDDIYIIGSVIEKTENYFTVSLDKRICEGLDITKKHLLDTNGDNIYYVPFTCGNESITNKNYLVERITKI